jgi:hypothetical protein
MAEEFVTSIPYNKWHLDGSEAKAQACARELSEVGYPWTATAGYDWRTSEGSPKIEDPSTATARWFVNVNKQDIPLPFVETVVEGWIIRIGKSLEVLTNEEYEGSEYNNA